MLKRTVLTLPLLATAMTAGTGLAQNQQAAKSVEPLKFYKLEFMVREVEGKKVLNARSYSMTVAAGATAANGSIRAGNRVPFQVGSGSQNFQYFDVGVNIDCHSVREVQDDLSLFVAAEISSVPFEPAAASATATTATIAPTVRQNKWSSLTIVPLNKPTLIFSSDDLGSKRQMQLELTATPIAQRGDAARLRTSVVIPRRYRSRA